MSRRKRQRERELRLQAAEYEWATALRLYRWLAAGGQLQPIDSSLVLQAGEVLYSDMQLIVGRHQSVPATYQAESTFVLGSPAFTAVSLLASAARNSRARRQAEDLARPQWRTAVSRVILTNLQVSYQDSQGWVDFGHGFLRELTVDPCHHVVAQFPGYAPLGLFGPGSSWFGVAWASLLFDRQRFCDLPSFQQFRAYSDEL